jgi:hypothetical protein
MLSVMVREAFAHGEGVGNGDDYGEAVFCSPIMKSDFLYEIFMLLKLKNLFLSVNSICPIPMEIRYPCGLRFLEP